LVFLVGCKGVVFDNSFTFLTGIKILISIQYNFKRSKIDFFGW